MIISASRRTDIPAYYSEWFINRVKESYVLVRNPMNFHQVSHVSLSPDVVDGIVFWSKNPTPMIDKLDSINNYTYYFQFTITPYGKDVEPELPSKAKVIIPAFQQLADKIGSDRIVWRYDPIFINHKYTKEYHIEAFEKIATSLKGYTKRCTISFVDYYRSIARNLKELNVIENTTEEIENLSESLVEIAHNLGLDIDACDEKIDFGKFGINRTRCIDSRLFEKLLDCKLSIERDKNQRTGCCCAASIDIGMYSTCLHSCGYCYANHSLKLVAKNCTLHNLSSPLLYGLVDSKDVIKERFQKSCKVRQIKLFD